MKRLSLIVIVGLFIAAAASAQTPPGAGGAGQRAGGPPPAPSNLQVLPKDTSREQVLTTMQAFTGALGVQCNYCHVQEGRGGRNDMASDEKPTKKAAREMMLLMEGAMLLMLIHGDRSYARAAAEAARELTRRHLED